MECNRFLIDLYSLHKDWIKIVRSFGEYFYAEDIVQEMYIKLSKHENNERFYRNGTIYKGFIWIVLRNMCYDFEKSKQRLQKVNISEAMQVKDESESNESLEAKKRIEIKIESVVRSWHYYDRMMYELYRDSGYSTREIQKHTGISFKSVWQTIKYCKDSLKAEVGECYEDLKNEDFELI